jgi:hypothetical protein
MLASANGYIITVKALLQRGADIDAMNDVSHTFFCAYLVNTFLRLYTIFNFDFKPSLPYLRYVCSFDLTRMETLLSVLLREKTIKPSSNFSTR